MSVGYDDEGRETWGRSSAASMRRTGRRPESERNSAAELLNKSFGKCGGGQNSVDRRQDGLPQVAVVRFPSSVVCGATPSTYSGPTRRRRRARRRPCSSTDVAVLMISLAAIGLAAFGAVSASSAVGIQNRGKTAAPFNSISSGNKRGILEQAAQQGQNQDDFLFEPLAKSAAPKHAIMTAPNRGDDGDDSAAADEDEESGNGDGDGGQGRLLDRSYAESATSTAQDRIALNSAVAEKQQQKGAKDGGGVRASYPEYNFDSENVQGQHPQQQQQQPMFAAAAMNNDRHRRRGQKYFTRVRRDRETAAVAAAAVPPSAVRGVDPAGTKPAASTGGGITGGNASNNGTAADGKGGAVGQKPTVVVDGDAEQTSGEGGYTSLDGPPEKVRVVNVGPFSFQLRWQKMAKDPGQPVTYVAEVTFVETPSSPQDGGDADGANSSTLLLPPPAGPAVQLITKDNSSFSDQQWTVGSPVKGSASDAANSSAKARAEDGNGVIRPYTKYRVRLRRRVGDTDGQFSPDLDVFTTTSVPERPQNVSLAPGPGEIVVTWERPRNYPGPMNYTVHILLWGGCPTDIPNVTCDCKKTRAGHSKLVWQVSQEEQKARRKVLGRENCVLEKSMYMVQLQAATQAGAGPLSPPQNVTTLAAAEAPPSSVKSQDMTAATSRIAQKQNEAPTQVVNLTATCEVDKMTLRWEPPAATNGILNAYEIKVEKHDAASKPAASNKIAVDDGDRGQLQRFAPTTNNNNNNKDSVADEEPTSGTVTGPWLFNVTACQWPAPSSSSSSTTAGGGGESEQVVGSEPPACTEQEFVVEDLDPGFTYDGYVTPIGVGGLSGPAVKASCVLEEKNAEALAPQSNASMIGGIVGGIVAACVLCGLGFFVWRRVAAPYARAKPMQPARSNTVVGREVQLKGQDNLAHEVDDVFEIKRKLDTGEIRDEFDLLCSQGPKLDANERAFARTSLSKNRFVNVLPFERTRVKLHDAENDYINASYVKGEQQEREYIATQAPKMETIRDFWFMVWQEEVTTIAMIAQGTKGLSELPPGFQYWPKLEVPMTFDSLTVYKMEDNSVRTGSGKHTVRIFVLEKGTETRSVTQIQFEEWPTVGVPEDTRPLNDYVVAVRQQNDYHVKASGQKPPLLVHCSAGTGRTGVVIALDRLRHQYKLRKAVDIPGTVHDLRQCRVHLVQTPEQYAFLYKCVVQMIEDFSTNVVADLQGQQTR